MARYDFHTVENAGKIPVQPESSQLLSKLGNLFKAPIQPPQLKPGYHVHIEQYRGLCALLVVMEHGFTQEFMFLNNFRWPEFMHYLGAGHLSVMVFFCISGYVIGISNSRKELNVGLYIRKRLVRLYPVYLVSLLLCIIVAGGISLALFAEHIFFFDNYYPYWNFTVPVFINFATWSLNYEVVYYLLFIAVFFTKPRVWVLLTGMLVLSLLMYHCNPGLVFLANYVNGFYFWILGLLIGWRIIGGAEHKNATIPLLSMLFLHLCMRHIGVGLIVLKVLGVETKTNFDWLFDLPFCLMIMGILTQKDNIILRINKIVCYITPGFVYAFLIFHHRMFENERWTMSLIYWGLSLVLVNEKRISARILNLLTGVGKISYALYLLHIPVAELLKKTIFINYQPLEVAVKYFLWIVITFSLAYLLDEVLQPFIKRTFLHSPSVY